MTFQVDITKPTQYDDSLKAAEAKYGLPENILKTVMMIENRNNPMNRVSPKGASGIMQIMPANFEALGITDPNDPEQSIEGGAKLLADSLKRYGGDVMSALADYNGGPKAAETYRAGKELNPETADYLRFAAPLFNSGAVIKGTASNWANANDLQTGKYTMPDELATSIKTGEVDELTGLKAELAQDLKADAKLSELDFDAAFHSTYVDNLTGALGHALTRETDENWSLTPEHEEQLHQSFPEGLSESERDRITNSRSQADYDYNLGVVSEQRGVAERMQHQDGLTKAGTIAGQLAGGIVDPVAMAIPVGRAASVVRGAGVMATAARGAIEGAAVMGVTSAASQQINRGAVQAQEVLHEMGNGAVLGAGLSGLAAVVGKTGKAWHSEAEKATAGRLNQEPEYTPPSIAAVHSELKLDFANAERQIHDELGATLSSGQTEAVLKLNAVDETVPEAVRLKSERLKKWYQNPVRRKMFGWADSVGVKLATSQHKATRVVGNVLLGDASGIGKVRAQTVAVVQDTIHQNMLHTYMPAIREQFERYATVAEKLDFAAGGGEAAFNRFSKEVQLERARRGNHLQEFGSLDNYISQVDKNIQDTAALMDRFHEEARQMHIQHGTEHSEKLEAESGIGYIEQRADRERLLQMSKEERKAVFDMVNEHYKAEAAGRVKKLLEGRADWVSEKRAFFEANPDAKGAAEFKANPEAAHQALVDHLAKKIDKEMQSRVSKMWDNMLQTADAKFQNSEAMLLEVVKDMASERLEGRTVDEGMLKQFDKAVRDMWSDTTRRRMDMTLSREVNGKVVHLLDAYNHNLNSTLSRSARATSGEVALAKFGWKTVQDVEDTISAIQRTGASAEDVELIRHAFDEVKGNMNSVGGETAARILSSYGHALMMGKLPLSLMADITTVVGNLGVGGMFRALGEAVSSAAIKGDLFVNKKTGRITGLGKEIQFYMKGLEGRDADLWHNNYGRREGMSFDLGNSLLRRAEASARFTNTLSGANYINRVMAHGVGEASYKTLHKALRTGKGLSEARLADIGLHGETLERVRAAVKQHGSDSEFGLQDWAPDVRDDFLGAAGRFVNQNRVDRKLAGEGTKWESTTMVGHLFARFRMIGFRAQEKVLVRNIAHMDSNTVAMLTAGMAMSTFLAYARIHLDAATSKDGKKHLKDNLTPEGVAMMTLRQSSILGMTSELGSIGNLLMGGRAQGADSVPLLSPLKNVANAMGAPARAFTDPKGAAADVARAMPGANTYWMLGLQKYLAK